MQNRGVQIRDPIYHCFVPDAPTRLSREELRADGGVNPHSNLRSHLEPNIPISEFFSWASHIC